MSEAATIDRPEVVTDVMLHWLDSIRDSGSINMFGVTPYVQEMFDVSRSEASTIVQYWMKTFGQDDR